MTDLRKAAEMALEALETLPAGSSYKTHNAASALRRALEQPDMGIDRGAWSDVPDATKWVDDLRGDEDSEQEPVAWDGDCVLGHCGSPDGCDHSGFCRAAPPSKPETHAVIAGVLFDFMGWLTTRKERLVLSSCDDASPAVKVIEEFAKLRGLSLDDAKVNDWQDITAPVSKPWVSLTDEERTEATNNAGFGHINIALEIEAKLKEKNNV